jgi:hypothetical protein
MNAIHQEAYDEKEKWKKANKTLQAKLNGKMKQEADESSSSDEMPPLQEQKSRAKSQHDSDSDSSDSSDPSIE